MTPEESKRRAEHARQLLDDPLLNEALDLIEKDCIDQWEAVPTRDVEGRELVWRYYKTAKKLRGILYGVIENGKVASFREQQSLMDKVLKRA